LEVGAHLHLVQVVSAYPLAQERNLPFERDPSNDKLADSPLYAEIPRRQIGRFIFIHDRQAPESDDELPEADAEERFRRLVGDVVNTPHQPHKPAKPGEPE
jgi:hypothetical protein